MSEEKIVAALQQLSEDEIAASILAEGKSSYSVIC